MKLYVLKFAPVYAARIWGGTQMEEVLKRKLPEHTAPIGESWEIVDRDDAQSVVVNGPLAGKTMRELMEEFGSRLTGKTRETFPRFPLLVKLIDAGNRLSLQVHPDEAACKLLGSPAEPKTEMWYIIAARKGAQILAGLSSRATKMQIMDNLSKPEIESLLQIYPSQPHDAYFIPAGTLHAIGGGNLILEIQQNSDTTYRVSDWGRVDAEGKSRTLHVDQALKSIHYMNRTSPRVAGVTNTADHNRKFSLVQNCRFFTVDDLRLCSTWFDDTAQNDSMHLISAINRPVTVVTGDGESTRLSPGETVLIPREVGVYRIEPEPGEESSVVRTTL
ncbi:MAG: class I mannose-6-phosphate isomerase [Victivallaceae bacterium]|nr:class I mannose-6-phosphate isomerase [Victivallaceae bacterium]